MAQKSVQNVKNTKTITTKHIGLNCEEDNMRKVKEIKYEKIVDEFLYNTFLRG